MKSRKFRSSLTILLAALLLVISCQQDTPEPLALEILKDEYPGSFFFRRPVSMIDLDFQRWDSIYCRLSGIIGKTLNEEIPGSEAAIEYYERFKRAHPEQMVLLHFNGNSRDPNDNSWDFHPAHWLYFEGCELSDDILAENGTSEIKITDPGIFHVNFGRYQNAKEDIGICRKTEDGKPDWNYSEQVQLVSVDHENKSIVVKRAMYGSNALKFTAGETLVCPHVSEGPWGGENNNLLWIYNRSSVCPKDKNGRTCNYILAAYLGKLFARGGKLQYYDGIAIDVLWNSIRNESFGRVADADCDGIGDSGYINGINTFFTGTDMFCKLLRQSMGPDKLITSDGFGPILQSSVKYLNGIESEGWPLHRDTEVSDWSGGWNRHLFWNENAYEPRFSYVNFKYMGGLEPPPVPRQRLVWATAQLMSVKISHGGFEPGRAGDFAGEYYTSDAWRQGNEDLKMAPVIEIIDEFVGGDLQKKFWLGKPLGVPVRLALKAPDLLGRAGLNVSDDCISMFSGENVSFNREDGELVVKGAPGKKMNFTLENILCEGPDLVVSFDVKGIKPENHPEGVPRLLNLWSSESNFKLMTWVNDDWFRATFYFRDIVRNNIDIIFETDSGDEIFIKDLTAHASTDAVYREFENGLVLANPAHHPYAFDLDELSPGRKYKRLTATTYQDKITNNGKTVGGEVILGERAGLFLLLDKK